MNVYPKPYREHLAQVIESAPNYNERSHCNVVIHCPSGEDPSKMGIIGFAINKEEYDKFFNSWIGFLRSECMLWHVD